MKGKQKSINSGEMHEFSFSVKHEGCWTADIVREYPGFEAKILESYAVTGNSSTIIELLDADGRAAEDVVEWMSDHPVIRSAELVRWENQRCIINLETDYENSETRPVGLVFREHPIISIAPTEIHDGHEHSTVMAPSKDRIQAVYEDLREYGPVEIRMINKINSVDCHISDPSAVSRAVSELSDRQQEILHRAIERGYYDVPKSCSIDELAEMDSTSMSTVAEHLRHAEFKIFRGILALLGTAETGESKKASFN